MGAGTLMLVTLAIIGGVTELGRSTRVVYDAPLELPTTPASGAMPADAEPRIQLSPPFALEGPTTLEVTLERSPEPAWVGASIAIVHHESGTIRELSLSTEVRASDASPSTTSSALVDGVESGTYVVRIEPGWDAVSTPLPGRKRSAAPAPPHATIRVQEGASTPWLFLLATACIVVPPLLTWIRFRRKHRSNAPATPNGAKNPSDSADRLVEHPTRSDVNGERAR